MMEQLSEDSQEVATLYHASSPSYILEFPAEMEMTDTTLLVKPKKKVRFDLPEEVHSCYREGPNCYLKPTLIFLLIVALFAGLISVSIQSSGKFPSPSDTSFDSSAVNANGGSDGTDASLPSPIETPTTPLESTSKSRGLWLSSTIDNNETFTDLIVAIKMLDVEFVIMSESVDKTIATELEHQTGARIVLSFTRPENAITNVQQCLNTDGCDGLLLDLTNTEASQDQYSAVELYFNAVSKFLPLSLRINGEELHADSSSSLWQKFDALYIAEESISDNLDNYFVQVLYKNFEDSKAEAKRLATKYEADQRFQGVYFQY